MKRFYKLFPICMILILLFCSHAFAQTSGNCASSLIKWKKTGEKIEFTSWKSTYTSSWNNNCTDKFKNDPDIKIVDIDNTIKIGNTVDVFNGCKYVEKMYLSNLIDTKSLYRWFKDCSSLEYLDISSWDTTGTTNDIWTYFQGCSSLTTLVLGEKSVNTNIFTSLPNYDKKWKKIDQPNEGTVLQNHELFTNFNSETMAGTWTTNFTEASPKITTQPVDLALTYGYSSGSLSVAAEISDGSTLSYQWYSNTKQSTEGASPVANAKQATYNYPIGESVSPAKYYYCVVTSGTGIAVNSDIVSVTIEPKPVTISGTLNADKTYDGTTNASFDTSSVTIEEIVNGDELGLSLTGTFSNANVGTWNVAIDPDSYQLTGEKAPNYTISSIPSEWSSLTANITPALIPSVAIEIDAPQGNVVLDTTAASSTANITTLGSVSWDPAGDSEGKAAFNTDYTASVTVAADSNYVFTEGAAATVNGSPAVKSLNDAKTEMSISYQFTNTGPETGFCGTSNSVKWSIDNDTISFTNRYDNEIGTWNDNCVSIFRENPGITKVTVDKPINVDSSMQYEFRDCSYVKEMDLSKFIIGSGVTNLEGAFLRCSALETLNVSGWNTQNMTNMSRTFDGCSSLQSLDLSTWNTAKVTHMDYLFSSCSNLESLDLSKWVTSSVIWMDHMFDGCSKLASITSDNNWNTSNVTATAGMFANCRALTDSALSAIKIGDWDTSNVTDMKTMFSGCSSLKILDLGKWNTSSVKQITSIFEGCSSLTKLNIQNWNTVNLIDFDKAFNECKQLTTLTLGQNSIKKNLFATLPTRSIFWLYEAPDPAISNPLDINSVLPGSVLLSPSSYNYDSMGGTWSAVDTVTVTFDPNEGNGSMAPQTVGKNIETALNKNDSYITRTGYSFAGWNTQANGGGTSYADGAPVTIAENLTLYAQWDPYKYTVSFDANKPAGAPDPAGEMTPQNFTYDVEQQLSRNNFKLTGYQFAGWNTQADGKGTPYLDEQSVKNLTAKSDGNVTLYGQWNPIDYTITLGSYDNGSVTANPAGTADAPVHYGDKVTLTIDPKEGYVLDTLEIKSSGGETVTYDAEAGTFTMPAENVTVSATFKPHKHEYGYSAADNVLTAVCADTDGGHVGEKSAELILNGPENLVYDGNAKSASVTGEIPGVVTPSIIYLQDGSVISEVPPANAGNYSAQITLGDATAVIEFTIGKATPEIEVPTASPIKNGQALYDSLLTGGSAIFGDTQVSGSFAWKDPSIRPEPSDSQNTEFEAVFIPEDTVNYNPVVIRLKLTVGVVFKAAVKFTVVNGAWAGGSTDEINVTLECGQGEELKLSAEQIPAPGDPAVGYKAGGWDVTPSTETVITGDTTYTYSFLAQDQFSHTVTFTVVNGYWDDGSSAAKIVTLTGYEGEELKLKAEDILAAAAGSKPGAGYRTGSWDAAPSTETAVTEDTVYTYSYEPVTYTVNVTTEGEGTAVPSVTSGPIGTEVTLTASPNEGYSFKGWDVITGGVTVSGDKFTIGTDNVVIKAVFEADQPESAGTVSVVKEGEGDAVANPSSNVKAGETVTLIAVPAEGYKFINWVVVSGGVTPDDAAAPVTAFSMGGENVQVKAVFESEGDKPFHGKVSVSTEGEGNAAANPASDVESGERVTLLAIPASGNRFVRWEVESGEVTPKDEESVSTAFIMENRDVSVKAVFAVGPEDDREAASVIEEPKAAEELTEQDEPQDLLAFPGKAEGGTMMYSLDGVDFSKKIPQETEQGTYTVYWYVKGDADHKDTEVSEMTVTIGERVEPMDLTVEFVNLKNNGSKGVPEEFERMELEPVITISAGDIKSKSKAVKLVLTPGIAMLTDTVRFNKKIEDLGPGKYSVSVSGLPKVFYATDQIYSSEEPVAGPVLWKYELTANAEINMKDSTAIIRVYLLWDNGARPEEIRVVALPEDEIGAYKLNEDGSKEYLLFHTYDICMAWLGNDDLCRGYERCFHKEF